MCFSIDSIYSSVFVHMPLCACALVSAPPNARALRETPSYS